MNVFAALFGIFRQRGLVLLLREQKPLRGFVLAATALAIVSGLLYGFAMGIGLGLDTALKSSAKIALILGSGVLIAVPIFGMTYRLLGREEPLAQVAAVPLTFLVSTALAMAVAAPIVFLLSVLAGLSPSAVYIHIVIVDLALLVGLYVAGTLVYHSFGADRPRLIAPNAISFVLLGVAIVVLVLFFGPFLSASPTFSSGTDMLQDRLGIGVGAKASQVLAATASAEQLSYRFQAISASGSVERDYTVTRVRDSYLVALKLHAVPGDALLRERQVWLLGATGYANFDAGRVGQQPAAELTRLLAPAMPGAAFQLPAPFAAARWRATESSSAYTMVGTTADGAQVTLTLDPGTMRLTSMLLGRADRGVAAEIRVDAIAPANQSQADIEASLRRATVLGSVDRSDATLQDYVQPDMFFVARLPRSWRGGSWDTTQRRVSFSADCGLEAGCPGVTIAALDLVAGQDARAYASALSASLGRQPQYRAISVGAPGSDPQVAFVEYLADRSVKGAIETTRHREYLFVGDLWCYHLDFSAPEAQFEASRRLFESLAGAFVYLSV